LWSLIFNMRVLMPETRFELARDRFDFPNDTKSCATLLHRLLAEDGHAPQQAPLAGGKICARVQCATVVPHQDVAGAPDMLVDELRLLLVVEELLKDCVAFLPRQTFDLARHQAIDI